MGITISQVLASLELYFYTRSVVRMALRRLTEKCSSSDEFNREIVTLILLQGYPFYSHRLYCFSVEQIIVYVAKLKLNVSNIFLSVSKHLYSMNHS